MQQLKNILLFVLSLFLLVACNPQPEAPVLLQQAQLLMEDNPDSALLLIDSIFYPEKSLNKHDYMYYHVAKVQAKYKTYRPVKEDTLIFEARRYFAKQNKDLEKTTLAHFYSGAVYRDKNHNDKAMQAYKDAATIAQKTNDADLKGMVQYNMGDMLLQDNLYIEAQDAYKKAEQFYGQSSKNAEEKQIKCLSAVGRMFLVLSKPDSTFLYLYKGLKLAEEIGNIELQSHLMQNLSIAYKLTKKYNKAEDLLRQSFKLNNHSTEDARYYLNFAKLYLSMGENDSVTVYKKKLLHSIDKLDDIYYKASAYNFLADWERGNQNFEETINYQDKRMGLLLDIMEKDREQSVYEVQKKYDYAKFQNQHNQTLITRHRIIIVLLTSLLLFSFVVGFLYRKTILQKNKLLQMEQAWQVLNETAKDIENLKTETIVSENTQREALLWKFDVLQKSTVLENLMKSSPKITREKAIQKFNEIVYGADSFSPWELILQTFDELNPELSDAIKKDYPEFSETEFKLCLLSYAQLKAKEIALILNISVHTVNMGRSNIRKKMKLHTKGIDFCEVLKERYT